MTPVQKLAGLVVLVLMAGAAGFTWQVQEWRMGKRLAEQAGLHQGELADVSAAAAMQVSCNMPTASGSGGVVHDATRAQLDPAHAQRIIAITHDGDNGLIPLRACQSYIGALTGRPN